MSPKSRRDRSSPIWTSTRSARRTPGRATGRRHSPAERRLSRRGWLRNSSGRRLRRSLLREPAELLLGDLQQLPLGLEARALDRLAQLDPLRVVHFAELWRKCPARVLHQIKVDPLSDQRVAGAKEVLDRVQWLDDLRFQ